MENSNRKIINENISWDEEDGEMKLKIYLSRDEAVDKHIDEGLTGELPDPCKVVVYKAKTHPDCQLKYFERKEGVIWNDKYEKDLEE